MHVLTEQGVIVPDEMDLNDYETDDYVEINETGCFFGFAITKGATPPQHRYAFTSRSFNEKATVEHAMSRGGRRAKSGGSPHVPKVWAMAIYLSLKDKGFST